jgi:hypothetical protein
MKIELNYKFRYSTKGGKHRYALMGKPKQNLGEVYLTGVYNPPPRLHITVEALDEA